MISKEECLKRAVVVAANSGCAEGVLLCRSLGVADFGLPLMTATARGHSNIAEICLFPNVHADDRMLNSDTRTHMPVNASDIIQTIEKAVVWCRREIMELCMSYVHSADMKNTLTDKNWVRIHECKKIVFAHEKKNATTRKKRERCWKTILYNKEACSGVKCKHFKVKGGLSSGIPTYLTKLVYEAICANNDRIINECHRFCHESFDGVMHKALEKASEKGHIEAVKSCKLWGVYYFDDAAASAARGGHVEIVKLLKHWGAENFSKMFSCASRRGNTEIMELCVSWGAINFEQAMYLSACSGSIEAILLCASWGATDYIQAFIGACSRGHKKAAALCAQLAGF